MFDVALTFFSKFIEISPYIICIYIMFDFIGSLLFGKR